MLDNIVSLMNHQNHTQTNDFMFATNRVHQSMVLKPDDASITDDGVVKHLTEKEGSVIQAVTPAVLYLSCLNRGCDLRTGDPSSRHRTACLAATLSAGRDHRFTVAINNAF
jgi:hypothetical protein